MTAPPYRQHHAVRSMRLEVRLADRQLARGVQEQLSQLTHRRLLGEMEAAFSQACAPGHTRRLEQLVVDLGVLRLEHLEEDLLERFAPRLRQALETALPPGPAPATLEAAGKPPSALALLVHLLTHGTLPWWAGAHAGASLEDMFLELAEHDPAAVEKVIRRLGSAQAVRLRLVRQFSPATLAALVALLEPEDAVMILQCAERLDALQEESPVAPVEPRDFYEAKWDLMLHTLVKEHGTRFNMKSFLRTNVAGLAQRFGMDYTTLIHHLAEAEDEPRVPRTPSLIETLLRELSDEAAAAAPAEKEVSRKGDLAADPVLLWEFCMRLFDPASDGTDAALAAGGDRQDLVKAWQAQPPAWQRALWEAVLFRTRAVEVARRVVRLFPQETWEEVQQSLPHPLEGLFVHDAAGNRSSDNARSHWWEEVFALALQWRGRGAASQQDAQALTTLLGPFPPAPASSGQEAMAPDSSAALKLFGQWLHGAEWPSALDTALPGGPEAWLVRLELHQPAATRALLRGRSGSRHWQRLAARATPSLRRRILSLLAPRSTAPLLLAALEMIALNRTALFGTRLGANRFEADCWAALAGGGAGPTAEVALQALRTHLDELGQKSGIAPSLLAERLHAVTQTLPAAAASALARWHPWEHAPGGRRSSLGRAMLHDPRIWREAWHAVLGTPEQARNDAFAALWDAAAQAPTPAARRRRLLAALTERGVLERIVGTAGGEDLLLWVVTRQPAPWRSELSAWLDLLEQTGAAAGLLRTARREWRWRALQAVVWHQRTGPRPASPRVLVQQLLRRLGVSAQAITAWKKTAPAALSTTRPVAAPSRRVPAFSPDVVSRLKHWRALLAGGPRGSFGAAACARLWAATHQNERCLYRELLEAHPPHWQAVQRILAAGGEPFFLWVAVNEPRGWRAEFSTWLAFLEKMAAAGAFLPFDSREWRARALGEFLLLDRQTTAHARQPGTVVLEVLRRLGVMKHVLEHWDAPGMVRAPARVAAFLRRLVQAGETHMQPAPISPALPAGPPSSQVPEKEKSRRQADTRPPEAGEDFYVENAGLVILAPFFSRYHEANGLLFDGLFRDPAAAERGAHLLQRLLTDGPETPEQSLVLNKVLCGLCPAFPVARRIACTETERTHADMLLQSAIQNWPQVGNLSLDGFRGSFLWRRGKLMRGEDRWTLTIEHRGYDVLFSSLPWSFSVIKPAWMPDPLYVDWV